MKTWSLCLWHTAWPGRPRTKKSQIYISNRIKISKVRCSSSQLVKIETINNEGPISTPFLGGLFLGACFPRKFWNFKAVKCIHQLTERERERERQLMTAHANKTTSLLMAEWQIEHRKLCLVLCARFPVVNWCSHPIAKSAYDYSGTSIIQGTPSGPRKVSPEQKCPLNRGWARVCWFVNN